MPRLSKIGAAALAAFGWTSGSLVSVSYLAVAGGGGGGGQGNASGAGGAGGFLTGTASINPTQSYTITVGAGGAGSTSSSVRGSNGSNSVFNSLTSIGGGGGGSQDTGVNTGADGGSGGGGAPYPTGAGGAGTAGQGNAGGAGLTDSATYTAGGGGGGAFAVGANAAFQVGGNGGAGTASSISGSSVTYAGGGGGGVNNSYTAGTGGAGGGGNGTNNPSTGGNGTTNLGGGGGGSGNGNGGSGGSGIVIISYVGAQQFGGGVVTSSGGNTIHTFTTSGTLSPLSSLTVNNYLIVAGGGGAGSFGGGGAGGLLSGSGITIDTNSIYTVTVGGGGAGVVSGSSGGGINGSNGSNSSFSAYATASVGGGGGGGYAAPVAGSAGGSGGGGGYSDPIGGALGGAGTSGQGNAGGSGFIGGAGGGGASAAGSNGGGSGSAGVGGAGGNGTASSISGSSVTYAGGGGGGNGDARTGGSGGAGGTGGGGAGGTGVLSTGAAGTANLGGGGGGGGSGSSTNYGGGGAGGSGVVIISYSGSVQLMAGGTVTVSGGNVIHTFTSSGFLTPIVLTTNSLRFRSSASAYLSRTGSTATNAKLATYSFWFKRGALTTGQWLFTGGASSAVTLIGFNGSSDAFSVLLTDVSGEGNITTALFRDPSAWYHFVIAIDTTQATTADRAKIYVNGVLQTVTLANGGIGINSNWGFNTANTLNIGRYIGASSYTDGYMTDINFIDGQALTPFSFGTSNGLGVWQPIRYGGSYGTNGFYLPFTNTTSTTTLGYDFSPQGNNWTTNNISLTAGSTYDSMTDVPTLTSATVANYCTLNPLDSFSSSLSNANLKFADGNGAGYKGISTFVIADIAASDKYYVEYISDVNYLTGIVTTANSGSASNTSYTDIRGYYSNGNKYSGTTASAYGASFTSSDQLAMLIGNGQIEFFKNNTSQGVAFTGLTGSWKTCTVAFGSAGAGVSYNFGQQPFVYTPPTGALRLNTFNLSTPTIGATAATTASKYFNAVTYTGTGAGTVITSGFYPDFAWMKNRTAAFSNFVQDSVRGGGVFLLTDTTDADSAVSPSSTFSSTGITINANSSYASNSSYNYVLWAWNANSGSTVSNTNGSITSTVSANTTAGFSVVTYSANGSTGTVGHGLGVTPSMIIVKKRNGAERWCVFHTATSNAYIYLNETFAADTTNANTRFGNNTVVVQPTSTLFTIGNSNDVNGTSGTYVAYCFAPIAGYSAFGSYTGNGSADGPFVFTGFRPRFVMVKCSSSDQGGNAVWGMFDTSRNAYNVANNRLIASSSNSESTSPWLDINSNGFKIRETSTSINGSGATYIYMAFAESPFKYANAR